MAKSIEQITTETIRELHTQLLNDPKPTSKADAIKRIQATFKNAFKQVTEEKWGKLYKKISLQLHSDKLERNQPQLHAYVKSIDAVDVLFQEINTFHHANYFQNMATDPFKGATDPFKVSGRLFDPLLKIFKSGSNEYKRYPQPIQALIYMSISVVNTAMFLAMSAVVVPFGAIYLITWILSKIDKMLNNLITGNQYNAELGKHASDPELQSKAKKNVATTCRNRLIDLAQTDEEKNRFTILSDDEILEAWIARNYQMKMKISSIFKGRALNQGEMEKAQKEAQADTEQEIKNECEPYGFKKILILFQACINAIATLPKGVLDKIAAILITKPLQALAIPLMLGTAAAIELVKYANIAISIGIIITIAAIRVAILVVLNSPIYLLDALRFMVNGFKSKVETPKPDAEIPKPDAEIPKPDAETPKPDAETPKPDAETPKPDAETPKPDAETPKPDAETPKPDAETPKPDAEVQQGTYAKLFYRPKSFQVVPDQLKPTHSLSENTDFFTP